jgi:hypothetical protein
MNVYAHPKNAFTLTPNGSGNSLFPTLLCQIPLPVSRSIWRPR